LPQDATSAQRVGDTLRRMSAADGTHDAAARHGAAAAARALAPADGLAPV
jgi:hypothetical protein